jgi:hypothetical protein
MKGLCTTVTNATNGKSYFVSTVNSARSKGMHETAVFRKIFGPFASFWRPRATFFGSDGASLHARVTALVRDVDPIDWQKAHRALLMDDAYARGDIHQILELSAMASPAEDFAALGIRVKDDTED